MHRLTVTRRVGALQTERAIRYFQTSRDARRACRRAIEPIAHGSELRAKTRPASGQPWRRLLNHEAERAWRDPYYLWPDRVTFRLRRTIHGAGDQTATEETRITLEPASADALAWQPFV